MTDKMNTQEKLAIRGGTPIRERPWPKWPRADANTERNLVDVLYSGRWAISGMYNGTRLYERRFADAFAAYHDVPYCVPVNNGAAALTVALEALGVGYGQEVLVPGVTWVACASAVMRVGGIPILVDVEPDTLCMSVEAAQEAITDRTAAIMLVHLYCAVGDIDAFLQLSDETGIPLLEDASQAHGAVWKGQRVGTYGKIGVFSMQDTKLLTCGEGGAIITSDPEMYDVMQQLRADGRRYGTSEPAFNRIELEEVGTVQGYNYNMSEFHAAILLDRLQHLDKENAIRARNAKHLSAVLAEIANIVPLTQLLAADQVVYYNYCASLEPAEFGNLGINTICDAVSAELGMRIEPLHHPLNNNILYNPTRSARLSRDAAALERIDPRKFDLPNANYAANRHFRIPHPALLGDKQDVEDIAAAFQKVRQNADLLR